MISQMPSRTHRMSVLLRAVWIATFLSVGAWLGSARAIAHPYHICVGQMAWNAQSKVWEVSLRLHPQDLERAMKQWRISGVEKTLTDKELVALQKGCSVEDAEFEKVVVEFLQGEFFMLSMPKGATAGQVGERLAGKDFKASASRIEWVGKETEKGWLWLHFELVPPKLEAENSEYWLVHKLLIDIIEKQENSLSVQRNGKDKTALLFKKGETAHRLPPP